MAQAVTENTPRTCTWPSRLRDARRPRSSAIPGRGFPVRLHIIGAGRHEAVARIADDGGISSTVAGKRFPVPSSAWPISCCPAADFVRIIPSCRNRRLIPPGWSTKAMPRGHRTRPAQRLPHNGVERFFAGAGHPVRSCDVPRSDVGRPPARDWWRLTPRVNGFPGAARASRVTDPRATTGHWTRWPGRGRLRGAGAAASTLDPASVGDSRSPGELGTGTMAVRSRPCLPFQSRRALRVGRFFAAYVRDWMQANPSWHGHQLVQQPGGVLPYDRARCCALNLFRDSAALTPQLYLDMVGWLRVHATHVEKYLSRYRPLLHPHG